MPQNLYAESLVLTSATFATAMINLIPGITFVVAILFRYISNFTIFDPFRQLQLWLY